MFSLGAIGFLSPVLLVGLIALPVLLWLLRAVPPAAIRRRFPAVTLLLGLKDPESTPQRTPWWLLLLRIAALAAVIIGFAGPILNPNDNTSSRAPLLILADASWASAPDWRRRQAMLDTLVASARQAGRTVSVAALTDSRSMADALTFQTDADLRALHPNPWAPDYADFIDLVDGSTTQFDTIWLSDGMGHERRAELASALMARGTVSVIEASRAALGLRPAQFRDGEIVVAAARTDGTTLDQLVVAGYGLDPAGVERRIASAELVFADSENQTEASFDLPVELRNRMRRFEIDGVRSAAAVAMADDSIRRRKVALLSSQRSEEGAELVSALHFLRKALVPTAEVIEAPLDESLLAGPDVVILADVASFTADERRDLEAWVSNGGVLLRFAGPRLAALSVDASIDDPLLPVRLRAGGRNVGGAMSWGSPRKLRPFEENSPFFGLDIPDEVTVQAQVVAQPDPDLAERVIATLADGTPLVTQSDLGEGRVVLVHVTANSEWSTLPLSGLFVQMLERLAISAPSAQRQAGEIEGRIWSPVRVLDAFGDSFSGDALTAVAGERLVAAGVGPDLAPGLYSAGDNLIAVNVLDAHTPFARASWPSNVNVSDFAADEELGLKGWFLALAALLLSLDIIATLWLSGRLTGPRVGVIASLIAAMMIVDPTPSIAQTADEIAILATQETVLAFVKTGDRRVDAVSAAGLSGLSQVLATRTSVEPIEPVALDLEASELAFYPMIYWPITETQLQPSDEAYRKLNRFLRAGGLILFDTRDANLGGSSATTPNRRRLQVLASKLEVPALEPVPRDHVMTRSFYLLADFPGRFARSDVWVEASAPDAALVEGMPFRNLNDGVTPVVIGGNDWAAAWAVGSDGQFMFPVGRGLAGEQQREMAFRFGVNLVMHVLTGNYKSDQVHVPALLDRLGQ